MYILHLQSNLEASVAVYLTSTRRQRGELEINVPERPKHVSEQHTLLVDMKSRYIYIHYINYTGPTHFACGYEEYVVYTYIHTLYQLYESNTLCLWI